MGEEALRQSRRSSRRNYFPSAKRIRRGQSGLPTVNGSLKTTGKGAGLNVLKWHPCYLSGHSSFSLRCITCGEEMDLSRVERRRDTRSLLDRICST